MNVRFRSLANATWRFAFDTNASSLDDLGGNLNRRTRQFDHIAARVDFPITECGSWFILSYHALFNIPLLVFLSASPWPNCSSCFSWLCNWSLLIRNPIASWLKTQKFKNQSSIAESKAKFFFAMIKRNAYDFPGSETIAFFMKVYFTFSNWPYSRLLWNDDWKLQHSLCSNRTNSHWSI